MRSNIEAGCLCFVYDYKYKRIGSLLKLNLFFQIGFHQFCVLKLTTFIWFQPEYHVQQPQSHDMSTCALWAIDIR